MVVKLISSLRLKRSLLSWDIKGEPLSQYNSFYNIRELLTIGSQQNLEDDEDDVQYETAFDNRKRLVNSHVDRDYKNADVLYWVFDQFWIQPMRTYISTRWQVKEDGKSLAEAMLKWSYLMPRRFLNKVLQCYLKPRLKRELSDNWNPKDLFPANLI
jgi:hypothetical protein